MTTAKELGGAMMKANRFTMSSDTQCFHCKCGWSTPIQFPLKVQDLVKTIDKLNEDHPESDCEARSV